MNKSVLTLTLAALFSAGCSAHLSPAQPQTGTGDSGGGNSYKGRPLDSYISSPVDQPGFQTYLQPILANLHEHSIPLERLFLYALKKKTWYFVPGDLNQLPPSQIGSAVPTEQVALQGFKQVWVNTEIFEKMTDSDKAKLILHETLMGIKILEFDSYKNQCLAKGSDASFCSRETDILHGKPSDITPAEYDQIRSAVAHIFANYSQYTSYQDWEDLMAQYGFKDFRSKDSKKLADIGDVYRWLLGSKIAGAWPTHGYDWPHFLEQFPELKTEPPPAPAGKKYSWTPHESCNLELTGDAKGWALNLRASGRQIAFPMPDYMSTGTGKMQLELRQYPPEGDNKTLYWKGQIETTSPNQRLGDHGYHLSLFFNSEQLAGVEVFEMVCISANEEGHCQQWRNPEEGGLVYYCSTKKQITFTY